ncbi:MAG: hypothetical protein ABR587_13000, partial [Candidatus Binatia bacterium]
MNVSVTGGHTLARRPGFLPALLIACIAVAGWASSADARFTCSTNQDCAARAAQCDPGRTPCNDGVCNPSAPGADAIGCVLIPNDSKCDDGLFCNGESVCSRDHGCQDPVVPNCNDGVACTLDLCDEVADKCTHVPQNTSCGNGQFCDGNEICSPTLGCIPGTAPACDDNIPCTVDVCNEATDSCTRTPNNALCSNGLFCDGVETCSPTQGCRPGTPPNCNDNIACTADSCNEAKDACDHIVSNAVCSNGSFCDGVETCSPTLGCRPGTPVNCSDGIPCTADSCDEVNDRCSRVPKDSSCSNGKFCDGVEICSATQGCRPGTPVNCSDNVTCTVDVCVEANDTCSHTAVDLNCNNNKFCDGVETCHPTLDCRPGTPPNCDDNVACTVDTCVESNRSCSHRENPAFCSNGQFCDGAERCDPLLGCYFGIPANCSDGITCTIDICIEETDTCQHTVSNPLCSDGLFCNGTETCDPQFDCRPGSIPDCNDGVSCTQDSCSDIAKRCINTPNHAVCNNSLFCDGTEICSPWGCTPGTAPDCNDGLVCTTDSCVEQSDKCLYLLNGGLCGNGVVDPACGEQCDGNDGEICNNEIDDDGDGLVDCQDPDCAEGQLPTCDEDCQLVPPCRPLIRDPAVISWGVSEERSSGPRGTFSFHGRIMSNTPIDPRTGGFVLTLRNANGEIYSASLPASVFKT